MRGLEILLERNIINGDEVAARVEQTLSSHHVGDPLIQKWFRKVYAKWVRESFDNVLELSRPEDWTDYRTDPAPDWFTAKVREGGIFYVMVSDRRLTEIGTTLAEYLTSLIGQPIHANENRFMRMTVPQVLEASERQHAALAKKMRKQSGQTNLHPNEQVVFEWPGGEFVVQFVTDQGRGQPCLPMRQAMARETDLMGICVGQFRDRQNCRDGLGETYAKGIEHGHMQIYSIRDPGNAPHVTIEIKDDVVRQVKGKKNEPPIQSYVSFVKDFLNHLGKPALTSDITRCRLYQHEGRYGDVVDVGRVIEEVGPNLRWLQVEKNYFLVEDRRIIADLSRNDFGDVYNLANSHEIPSPPRRFWPSIRQFIKNREIKLHSDSYALIGMVSIGGLGKVELDRTRPMMRFSDGAEIHKIVLEEGQALEVDDGYVVFGPEQRQEAILAVNGGILTRIHVLNRANNSIGSARQRQILEFLHRAKFGVDPTLDRSLMIHRIEGVTYSELLAGPAVLTVEELRVEPLLPIHGDEASDNAAYRVVQQGSMPHGFFKKVQGVVSLMAGGRNERLFKGLGRFVREARTPVEAGLAHLLKLQQVETRLGSLGFPDFALAVEFGAFGIPLFKLAWRNLTLADFDRRMERTAEQFLRDNATDQSREVLAGSIEIQIKQKLTRSVSLGGRGGPEHLMLQADVGIAIFNAVTCSLVDIQGRHAIQTTLRQQIEALAEQQAIVDFKGSIDATPQWEDILVAFKIDHHPLFGRGNETARGRIHQAVAEIMEGGHFFEARDETCNIGGRRLYTISNNLPQRLLAYLDHEWGSFDIDDYDLLAQTVRRGLFEQVHRVFEDHNGILVWPSDRPQEWVKLGEFLETDFLKILSRMRGEHQFVLWQDIIHALEKQEFFRDQQDEEYGYVWRYTKSDSRWPRLELAAAEAHFDVFSGLTTVLRDYIGDALKEPHLVDALGQAVDALLKRITTIDEDRPVVNRFAYSHDFLAFRDLLDAAGRRDVFRKLRKQYRETLLFHLGNNYEAVIENYVENNLDDDRIDDDARESLDYDEIDEEIERRLEDEGIDPEEARENGTWERYQDDIEYEKRQEAKETIREEYEDEIRRKAESEIDDDYRRYTRRCEEALSAGTPGDRDLQD
jgi:hypothetical protein